MRGVGSETRKNLRRLVGSRGALRPKVFFDNWLLGPPLGVSPHAFPFGNYEKKTKCQKILYADADAGAHLSEFWPNSLGAGPIREKKIMESTRF